MVVFISAARDVRDVEFSTRDFLINDCIIVKMSVKADDFVKKPPRAGEMNTTNTYSAARLARLSLWATLIVRLQRG